MNVIIAILSDGYNSVNQNSEYIFWDHRFEFIYDVDAFCACFKCFHKNKELHQTDAAVEKNTFKHAWFTRIVHSEKMASLPKPIKDALLFAAMAVWFIIGLCTIGIALPRSTRRKFFSPSAHEIGGKEMPEESKDHEVSLMLLTEEVTKLRQENDTLRQAISDLKSMVS